MDTAQLTTADCLRMLLDHQVSRLRIVADRIESVTNSQMPDIPPKDWNGDARRAYDDVVNRLRAELTRLDGSLLEATNQSRRAMNTLERRVG